MPHLALALAASGSAGEAQVWIARANEHAADLTTQSRARLAVARALAAQQYGEGHEIECAFSDYRAPMGPPDEEFAYCVPSLLARSRLWLGGVKGACEACEPEVGRWDDPSLQQVVNTSALAWVACVDGRLAEAEQLAHQALTSAGSIGLIGHPVMVEALCAQARVAFERGELDAAERLFEQSMSISEGVRPSFELQSQLLLSRVWFACGRVRDALDGITHTRTFLPPHSTSPLLDLCVALE